LESLDLSSLDLLPVLLGTYEIGATAKASSFEKNKVGVEASATTGTPFVHFAVAFVSESTVMVLA
jgi:hypothetical protein